MLCHCTIFLKKTCFIILIVATATFAQLFLCYFLLIKMIEEVESLSTFQRFSLVQSLLLALSPSREPHVGSVLDSTENIVMLSLQILPASHAGSILWF